jgi:MinD-like ATPase involved in chromosome partitioning or flagellar assembly
VLGFMGVKGGAGATTIVLNAAAILARQKKSVIALELRSYGGSFASQTLQAPSRNLKHLLDLEPEGITPAELRKCLVNLTSGAQAIYAPQKAEEFMEIPPAQAEAILRGAGLEADYVLVDLPAQACYLTQAAVRHCDLLTLVVERDAAGLAAGGQAVQLLRHWGVEDSSIAAVIVIKDALAGFISPADMASGLGCRIAGIIPPAADLCAASARVGTPFALMQPDSIAATNLIDLVDKLASRTRAPMTV